MTFKIGFAAFGEKEEKTAEVSPAMEETPPLGGAGALSGAGHDAFVL